MKWKCVECPNSCVTEGYLCDSCLICVCVFGGCCIISTHPHHLMKWKCVYLHLCVCVFGDVVFSDVCFWGALVWWAVVVLSPSSGCVVSCVCMSALVATLLHCLPLFVCCRVVCTVCNPFSVAVTSSSSSSSLAVTFHLSRLPPGPL